MGALWRGTTRATPSDDPACANIFGKYRLAADLSSVRGTLPTYLKAESRESSNLRADTIRPTRNGADLDTGRECEEI